jgi:uncharacterized protein YdeI (YjbR/CyaY-like superfamily)
MDRWHPQVVRHALVSAALYTAAGAKHLEPDQFALAFRMNNVKTPVGRARKIAALVAMLVRGDTIVSNADRKAQP